MFYPKRLFSISGQISRLNLKWLMFFFILDKYWAYSCITYVLNFLYGLKTKNWQAQLFHLRTDIDIIQPTINIGTDR